MCFFFSEGKHDGLLFSAISFYLQKLLKPSHVIQSRMQKRRVGTKAATLHTDWDTQWKEVTEFLNNDEENITQLKLLFRIDEDEWTPELTETVSLPP